MEYEGYEMQKTLSVALAAALTAATAGAALAGDVRGRVEAVDTEANVLVLDNGIQFTYGDDIDEASFGEGDLIKVVYKKTNGALEVRRVGVISKKN
jgi:hypothetical protein